MKKPLRLALLAAALLPLGFTKAATDPFLENIRPTDAQPADVEAKSFHLPKGFEIQLVAAEPLVGKPFNMAFDGKGRLWVTVSKEYPFPSKTGKGADDRIMILEDFDDNGHARKVTTFADNLNIPIGIYPYKDGCIAYSIPNISFYEDTDGDGKADKVTKLLGPFGYDRDTHGMSSNYRRGYDGWVYGCHGFNNETHAKALDGSELNIHSGNTYRFKVDGSHVEQYTWGQTNPFGLVLDRLGNFYTADSHSKPIYQIIRGGYYEGINKHDDGLGFAPWMMTHLHNSTAIASSFVYTADAWPKEYQGNTFNGNVVTSRINRDSITLHGSSPEGIEQPDFLTTDDPWFRPVQLQMGPDGQMWVADFYNKIIGHYEVPLTNPLRDHTHGRIWRIVYKGDAEKAPAPWRGDLTKADVAELLETLKSPNLMLRMLATDQLSDRVGDACIEPIKAMLSSTSDETQKVHGLWVLKRLNAEGIEPFIAKAANDESKVVRVHAMRVLSETPNWTAEQEAIVEKGLTDPKAMVVRVAADAMGTHPKPSHLQPLLEAYARASANDTHLVYQLKVALRETLKSPEAYEKAADLSTPDAHAVAVVSLAVPSEAAGKFLSAFIGKPENKMAGNRAMVLHAMRYAPAADAAALAKALREQAGDDLEEQLAALKGILEANQQRGVAPADSTLQWANDLAAKLLTTKGDTGTVSRREVAGAELAGLTKSPALAADLSKIVKNNKKSAASRAAAAKGWAAVDAEAAAPELAAIAGRAGAPTELRHACIDAAANHPASRQKLIDGMAKAQAGFQSYMARALATSLDGGNALFAAVAAGKVTPRVLQNLGVVNKLKASGVPDVDKRIADLTRGLPPEDEQIQKLINARRAGFHKAQNPSPEKGFAIFQKNCMVCHSIDGKGAVVGPQLDGVGNRGLDRLLEDVLDPNRSVDPAFHAWDVRLKDGTDLTGILRREEGATYVYADSTGKEIVVPKDQVEKRKESSLSLMPSNFGELLPEKDFYDLMSFLLSKNAKK